MILLLLPMIFFKIILFEMSYMPAALLVAVLFAISRVVEYKVAHLKN